jgi:hypothetical protein
MKRVTHVFVLLVGTLAAGCAPLMPSNTPITESRWLDQNWSDAERFWFHHATQGTSTLPVPYNWFIALEQPQLWLFGEAPLMKDSDYLRRFGFIPSPASLDADDERLRAYGYGSPNAGRAYGTAASYEMAAFTGNADGLPVGFARTRGYEDPVTGAPLSDQIGLTCAACHTGHLEYKGVSVRIDGAPAMTDLGGFRETLGLALFYTRYVPFRFGRFADRVLGENHSPEERGLLRTQLDELLARGRTVTNLTADANARSVEEGFTRLDALNRIGNQLFFTNLQDVTSENFDAAANFAPTAAPVNYPHIWDTSWFDWVQYDASIMQPMVRNAGEALGVGARVNLVNPDRPLYGSSVEVREIFNMESLLAGDDPLGGEPGFKGLRAPEWPQDVLGPIDPQKRARGEALYRELCPGCHLPPVNDPDGGLWSPRLWTEANEAGNSFLKVKQIPVETVGTDPGQAEVLANRTVKVPAWLGLDPATLCDGAPGEVVTEASFATALGYVVERTVERWYDDNAIPPAERARMNGDRPNCLQAAMVYKARPLDGIWATAPYLHNGSVPTLWALLSPVEERPREFCLGSRLFNPKEVGYSTECVAGAFRLDTTIDGNRNTGHAFSDGPLGNGVIGRALGPDERWDVIEFLKSL